jgi:sulfonate transport system substrate-binding protein
MSIKDIHYTICPVGNASYIAANKNLLKDGLGKIGVTPLQLQTLEPELWKTHFTYQNDVLFREGGNIPPLWAKSNDTDVLLIGLAVLDQKQHIIVRANSDIDTIEQLRKRKIGIPVHQNAIIDFHRASAEHGFKIALSARGVSEKEVDLVEVLEKRDFVPKTWGKINPGSKDFGATEVEALDNGEVDALYVRGTRSQKLLDTGKYKSIFEIHANPDLLAPINNEQPNTLTVSRKLAESRPEIVVNFIKQVILAAEWAKTNYAEVLNLFAEQTFGTPGQVASAYLPGFHKNLTPELSEKSLALLEGQKRFLFDRGYLKKDFPLEKWADDSFLKAAWAEINSEKEKE